MARSRRELLAAYDDAVDQFARDRRKQGGAKALKQARETVAKLRAEARTQSK